MVWTWLHPMDYSIEANEAVSLFDMSTPLQSFLLLIMTPLSDTQRLSTESLLFISPDLLASSYRKAFLRRVSLEGKPMNLE